MKTCPKCKQLKEDSEFTKRITGLSSWCKKCTGKASKESVLKKKDYYAKQAAEYAKNNPFSSILKNAKKSSRKRKQGFNIKMDDLRKLWAKQQGKCYWSGLYMTFEHGMLMNPKSVSLDRLDCDKGYSTDNVVLCCSWANMGRQQTPVDKWKEFLKEVNMKGLWI